MSTGLAGNSTPTRQRLRRGVFCCPRAVDLGEDADRFRRPPATRRCCESVGFFQYPHSDRQRPWGALALGFGTREREEAHNKANQDLCLASRSWPWPRLPRPARRRSMWRAFSRSARMSSRQASGSLDVTDLPVPGLRDISDQAVLAPVFGFFVSGASGVVIDKFSGIVTGPTTFGFGISTLANSSGGDGVGLDRTGQGVFVPKGYVSGARCRTHRPISTHRSFPLEC
jgi:hypothetical protein